MSPPDHEVVEPALLEQQQARQVLLDDADLDHADLWQRLAPHALDELGASGIVARRETHLPVASDSLRGRCASRASIRAAGTGPYRRDVF